MDSVPGKGQAWTEKLGQTLEEPEGCAGLPWWLRDLKKKKKKKILLPVQETAAIPG